jgi:hypothetical protein
MGKHRAPSRRLKLLALGSLIDLSGMETYERARSQVPQRAPKAAVSRAFAKVAVVATPNGRR